MLFIRLLRFLRGYVKFTARSGSVERFISLCARKGVLSWGNRRVDGVFWGYTTIRSYRKMHSLARKAGVATRVTERHGLPFLLRRYRKRLGAAAGALLFVLFLTVMQQFIWTVRIEGCEQLDPRLLQNALNELGVRRGAWRHGIDPAQVRNELVIMVDDLAWAALNLRGVTATLLVRERTPIPEKVDADQPANVVALQDGQIKRLEVLDGKAVLRAGDTVRAGEIIVSGVNEDRWGMTHLVRANARVIAHVPETVEVAIPLTQERAKPTGKVVRRRYLEVMGLRIPLFLYSGLEGEYKVERLSGQPELLGMALPFEISRETYVFFEREVEQISQETALRIAERELLRQERAGLGGRIVSVRRSAKAEDGVLILTGSYTIERDIARQVEIPVFDRAEQQERQKNREGGY